MSVLNVRRGYKRRARDGCADAIRAAMTDGYANTTSALPFAGRAEVGDRGDRSAATAQQTAGIAFRRCENRRRPSPRARPPLSSARAFGSATATTGSDSSTAWVAPPL